MSNRPVVQADRLSAFETLMWTLERDAQLASGFANITFLDRPADLDRLRARMQRAAALIPQLRRRILEDAGHIAPPRWVDDPDFSIERHVRAEKLAEPGGIDQVLDAAMAFCHRPYDRDHPLWEFLLIDGLADGRGAMLQRFHHTVADGVGMIRMSEQFIDLERDPDSGDTVAMPETQPLPSRLEASRDALGHALWRVFDSVRQGVGATGAALRDPGRLRDAPGHVLGTGRALTAEVTSSGRRRSPLWTTRSENHTLRLLRIPFAAVREAATRDGVTINDVFVTAAAGGVGAYHRLVGSPVDELRMAMPVNTRTDRSAGGNAFGMARVLVPTLEDPATRLDQIHDRLAGVRGHAGVSMLQNLAGVANLLPAPVLLRLARSQVSSVDFATSNVRGAPFPVFMGGARVESNHPIGPLAGTAFNLTMLSYNGSLDMGLHIDTGAVEDPDLLIRCISESFDQLLGDQQLGG